MVKADFTEYDFETPENYAQHPFHDRNKVKLCCVPRDSPELQHLRMTDIPKLFIPGDLLILNDFWLKSRRLIGRVRDTDRNVEVFLLIPLDIQHWKAIVCSDEPPEEGMQMDLAQGKVQTRLIARYPDGCWTLAFKSENVAELDTLPVFGTNVNAAQFHQQAVKREFTRMHRRPGSVQAPTAGLHFNMEILNALRREGVQIATLSLVVSSETSREIQESETKEFEMHQEYYTVPGATIDAIKVARERGRRVVAAGTTVVRALETVAKTGEDEGITNIFLSPPYKPKWVDGLLTNFHSPRSTLLMLVSTLIGRERLMETYQLAMPKGYRFGAFGDPLIIL
jgi:S-adenosylmethionine:tRNA ribosyltransferase-isomerase